MTKEIGRLLTAMVTPFQANGAVDYDAAGNLAAMLVADGSDGIVVSGTTGESPTLSDAEKIELIRAVKEAIPGKTVVAGTGSNNTHHSVELSELAMKAGADALLAVVPYYNKPPQDGMYQHFKAIAEVGPTIMYNIQGRTAINMTASTTLRCAALPGIIGVKEASGDLDQMGLLPVIKALMTTAANPVPVKSAMQAMGFPAGPFRLPLVPLSDEQLQSVMKVIREAGDLITFKAGVKVA